MTKKSNFEKIRTIKAKKVKAKNHLNEKMYHKILV